MRPRGRLGVIVIATALMLAGIALMRISDSRDPSVTTAAAVHRSDRAGGDALQVSQGNAMPRPHTKSPPAGNPAIAPAILAVRAKLAAESITPANAAARGFSGRSTPWVRVDAKLRVQTYIYTSAQGAAELQSLTERGVKVELVSAAMDLVQGWVPLDALDQVAALPFVLRLPPPESAKLKA